MFRKLKVVVIFILAMQIISGFNSAGATVHEIQVGNFFFSPTNITVVPGDTVKWKHVSGLHTTTSDQTSPKQWDSGDLTDSFMVAFEAIDGPGPFPYHCFYHSVTMKDTIFMSSSTTTCYVDADGDGFGDPLNTVDCPDASCMCQPGLVSNDLDCDDGDASINPAATEFCNGVDDDCNGTIDDNAADCIDWYPDTDGDGFGDGAMTPVCACSPPEGYVDNGFDCDDTDASINPDAEDIPDDGIDQNCDGVDAKTDCCDTPGDANDDGQTNVGDAVFMINFVFKGGPAPPCLNEGDANADCQANVGDAVFLINFVFKGGPAPDCGCAE
jgi:plastocyanin